MCLRLNIFASAMTDSVNYVLPLVCRVLQLSCLIGKKLSAQRIAPVVIC